MSEDVRFLQRGRKQSFDEGQAIFELRDPCSDGDVFYVISGEVEVRSIVQDSQLASIRLGPGSVFGVEEPYAGERHRQHKASAVVPTEVYRWNRQSFDEAMGIYQELATQVIRDLSGYLRKLNRAKAVEG